MTTVSTEFVHGDQVRGLILIAFLAGSFLAAVPLFTFQGPPPKLFSFTENISETGQSVNISDVNGGVLAEPWAQNQIQISGTVRASGPYATPDQVILEESNEGGMLRFKPVYPQTRPSTPATYIVNVTINFPSNTTFSSFTISTLNGGMIDVTGLSAVLAGFYDARSQFNRGRIQLSQLSASRLAIGPDNADVQLDLATIQDQGYYSISGRGYGSISLTLPGTGGFRLTAQASGSGFGLIGTCPPSGGACSPPTGFNQCQTSMQYYFGSSKFTATCGDGSAIIDLHTLDGNISIERTG